MINIEGDALHEGHILKNLIDSDSSESDGSTPYHTDEEVITSILHFSNTSKVVETEDVIEELFENERRQLEAFEIRYKGLTTDANEQVQLKGLEHIFRGERVFIYTRPSFHRAITKCKNIPVPKSVKYVSCIISTTRPVFLLTVISNDQSSDNEVEQYKACIARTITETVRIEVVKNFNVVTGIIREKEGDEEGVLRAKLKEFTTSTRERTFPRALDMNAERCVAVIRCFLAMVGVEKDVSPRETSPTAGVHEHDTPTEIENSGLKKILIPEISRPTFALDKRKPQRTTHFQPAGNLQNTSRGRHDHRVFSSKQPSSNQNLTRGPQYPNEEQRMFPGRMTDDDKALYDKGGSTQDPPYKPEHIRKWGPKTQHPWNAHEIENIRQELVTKCKLPTGKNLKILLFGPTGHGKSSLGNSLLSGLQRDEEVSHMFSVGTSNRSYTKAFNSVKILGGSWLIDMPGIFESRAITDANIEDIVSGKVPFYAELSKHLKVRNIFIDPPPGKNDVSCVVIVLNFDHDFGDEVKRQLDVIKKLAGKGVISYQLVLTHLDKCDEQFIRNENLPHMYNSEKVQEAVQRMADEAGVPPYCISFVKNYVRETEKHPFTTLQHLLVLKKILHAACDQTKKRQDMACMKKSYSDSFFVKYRVHIAMVILAVMISSIVFLITS